MQRYLLKHVSEELRQTHIAGLIEPCQIAGKRRPLSQIECYLASVIGCQLDGHCQPETHRLGNLERTGHSRCTAQRLVHAAVAPRHNIHSHHYAGRARGLSLK